MTAILMAIATTTHSRPHAETEVRRQFASHPVLIAIARCESGMRHFDDKGRVLKNPHSSATGVMQLMYSVHHRPALRQGLDIRTLKGNLAYALRLYKQEGTRPWNASRHCWR